MSAERSPSNVREQSDDEQARSESQSSASQEHAVKLREEDMTDDDIDCPLEELDDEWDEMPLDKKRRIMELVLEEKSLSKYHPARSLHKTLFDASQWRKWIHPNLLAVLDSWHETSESGKPRFQDLDIDAFEGLRTEAPGIISFPAFTDDFCQLMQEEAQHCHTCGVPTRQPNGMNKYGMVLNDIGFRPLFDTLLQKAFRPLGARLFGDDAHRASTIQGDSVSTEDWGGSSLDSHHTFLVEYKPGGDKHLDMHIDSCDITFNFGITASDDYKGSDLTFCGMFHHEDHRLHHFSYRHARGRCVIHSGKRRHGARDIEEGERSSLVMWTHSERFRRTRVYDERYRRMVKDGAFDRVCLSYTHDSDYKRLMPQKQQFHMKSKEQVEMDTSSSASTSTQAPLTQKVWVSVCKNSELREGGAKARHFEKENEQVAVFRHHGELFALDNRCAHMGGPLCEGDLEDLGVYAAKKGKQKPQNSKDGVVKCPLHGMCFNIRTGENINGSPFGKRGYEKQKLYPVRVSSDGEQIEVEMELELDSKLDYDTNEELKRKVSSNGSSSMYSDMQATGKATQQLCERDSKWRCNVQ